MKKLKSILILIFILICFFCWKKQTPKINLIKLNVNNININSFQDTLNYTLINNDRHTYVFYMDPTYLKQDSIDYKFYFTQLRPRYSIFEYDTNHILNYESCGIFFTDEGLYTYDLFWKNNKKKESEYLVQKKKLLKKYDKNWVLNNNYYRKNRIFLASGGKYEIKIPIRLNNNWNIYNMLMSYYQFMENKNYDFELNIKIDSTIVKTYLLPEELDSLKKNKIKIFHGELKSNRIPIIIDDRGLLEIK